MFVSNCKLMCLSNIRCENYSDAYTMSVYFSLFCHFFVDLLKQKITIAVICAFAFLSVNY